MKVLCNYCSKKLTVFQGQMREHQHHFCNKDCYYKWKKNHYTYQKGFNKDMRVQRKLDRWSQEFHAFHLAPPFHSQGSD